MILKEDGNYKLDSGIKGQAGGATVIFISGTLDNAVAKLQYMDDFGELNDLEDGQLLIGSQYSINNGDVPLFLDLSGSTANTSISVLVTGKV